MKLLPAADPMVSGFPLELLNVTLTVPPDPVPLPAAFSAPVAWRFPPALADRAIAPPLPLVPSGLTSSDVVATVKLPPAVTVTAPPLPLPEPPWAVMAMALAPVPTVMSPEPGAADVLTVTVPPLPLAPPLPLPDPLPEAVTLTAPAMLSASPLMDSDPPLKLPEEGDRLSVPEGRVTVPALEPPAPFKVIEPWLPLAAVADRFERASTVMPPAPLLMTVIEPALPPVPPALADSVPVTPLVVPVPTSNGVPPALLDVS